MLSVLVSLALMVQFAGQVLLIRLSGLSDGTDIYYAALVVPMFFAGITSASLQAMWLPKLSQSITKKKKWQLDFAISLGQALIIGVSGYVLSVTCMQVFSEKIFIGLKYEDILRIKGGKELASLMVVYSALSTVLICALRSQSDHKIVEVINLVSSGLYLSCLYLPLDFKNTDTLLILLNTKMIILIILLLTFLKISSIELNINFRFIRWRVIAPLLLSSPVYKLSPVIDKYWVSQLGSGIITSLNIVTAWLGAVNILIERILIAPKIPRYAILAQSKHNEELIKYFYKNFLKMFVVMVLVVVIILCSKSYALVFFSWLLNLKKDDAVMIYSLLIMLSPTVFLTGIGSLVASIFYSYKKIKLMTIIGVMGFFLSIVLKYSLFNLMGFDGYFLAVVSAHLITLIISMIILHFWVIKEHVKS